MKGNGRALMDVPVIGDILPYLILIWLVIQVAFPLIRAGYRFIRDLEKPKVDSAEMTSILICAGSVVLAGGILIGGGYLWWWMLFMR